VGTFADPASLFLYWPLVVANAPPARVTLDRLDVRPAAKQITISAPTGTEQFSAIGQYSDGSTAFFTSSAAWSTSNAAVGSFNPLPFYNGLFTVSGYGTTNVTATVNGLVGATTFTVSPVPVTGLAMTTASVSLPQGVPLQFRVTATYSDATTQDVSALATWSVSDPAVVELGAAPGALRGIGVGVATVTASYDGFTATATYTVIAPTVGAGVSRAAFVYAPRQRLESGATASVMQRLSVAATGALTLQPDSGGTTKIHAMKLTNDSRYLFMLQAEDFALQTALTVHRVDAGNGKLTQVSSAFASLNGQPGSIAIDPTGQFIYASTTSFPSRVRGYRFDEQAGTLTQVVDIQADAALAMDPAGQYLYVAGAFGGLRTYRIEPTGALSLASTTPLVMLNTITLAVHGSGDFVYVAGNPQTYTPLALMFRVTRATGALTAIGDPVMLPIPMSAGNTAAYVMTAAIAGNFFYAGSYNDGLRSYAIDNVSGQLYELAVTNPLPLHDVRAIAAESGGQYLFVAARDRSSGLAKIQAYALGIDGGLTTVGAFADPASLFLYWPLVVANKPPAGVTLSSLEVSPANKQVITGAPAGTEQFNAIGHYSDGSTAFFTAVTTWSTSNPAVGSFDPLPFYNGLFTISGYGTTNVTATVNGLTATTTFSASNVVLSLGNLHYVYDGTAKAAVATGLPPAATGLEILYNGATQPPTEAGSYNVVASINNPFYFAASATGTLIIEQAPSETTIECSGGPFTYNGLPLTPCSAVATGAGLQQQLVIDYANNINAGVADATATFAGDANHLPSSDNTTFTIGKAASAVVVSCPIAPQSYTGSPITPCTAQATAVSMSAVDVTASLQYTNNIDAGTADASASWAGDANHAGSSGSSTFVIAKAASTTVVSCGAGPLTYTGVPQTPCSATVTGAGLQQQLVIDYANNINAGVADASVTFAGDANHLPSSDSTNFTIGKAASAVVVSCPMTPQTYSGAPITPCTGQATAASMSAVDVTASLQYTNNIAAGTAGASAGWAGDANHAGSSGSSTFAIGKAASTTVVSCSAGPITYAGVPQTPCSATVIGAGGLNESLPVLYGNNINAGIATASAAHAGSVNYSNSSDNTTFMIGKANPTINVEGYDVVFDGAAHTSTGTATGALNETLSGLNLAATTHTAVGVYNDVWTFTDATGNYTAVTGTVANTIRGGLSMIGFHQPVAMGALNTVKGGSAVPLKFNIYEGAHERKNIGAVRSFDVMSGTCSGVATEAVPFVTTGATSLRYDSSAGQFIQNWKTPATSGVCYQVIVTAEDGTRLTALFRTK